MFASNLQVRFLIMVIALVFASSCGQSPSFVDQTQTARNGDDAVINNGNPEGIPGESETEGQFPDETGTDGDESSTDGVDTDTDTDEGDPDGDSPGEKPGDKGPGDPGDPNDPDNPNDPNDPNDPNNPSNPDDPGDPTNPDKPVDNEKPTMTREMEFDSSKLGDGAVISALDVPYIDQEFTLVRNNTDRTKFYVQKTRPDVTDQFTQGHGPTMATETFRQTADRPLDIVVVVDNSGSMVEEQAKLASKLEPLLGHVQDANWQIGVTSTDPNRSCLEAVIKKGDAQANQKFRNAVSLGDNGSGNERGVLMAVKALKGECLTQPWLRANSTVAVLIVSDEDNCSNNGSDCGNNAYAQGSYLHDYLASIRTPKVNAKIHGIIWHPSQSSADCSTGYNQAHIYSDLIAQTEGHWGSICDNSYSQTLKGISENIQEVLAKKFTLANTPDPGTLEVRVDGVLLTTGYQLNGKIVVFDTAPTEDQIIEIKYGHGSSPVYTTFKLSKEVYGDIEEVRIGTDVIDPAQYTFDSSANTVTFAAAPADRATIAVDYVEDIALTKDFLMFDDLKESSLKVDIDGTPTTDFDYVEVFRMVSFNVAPPAGSKITFQYVIEGPAVLSYPMDLDAPPVDLKAWDKDTNNSVNVTWSNDKIYVDSGDFIEGRTVVVRRDNVARNLFEVEAGVVPVPSTITAESGAYSCSGANKIKVSGTKISVEGCQFPDDAMDVTVRFQYLIETYTVFTFDMPGLPGSTDFQKWQVYIDGAETKEFDRTDNVITLRQPAPAGSKVKVKLTQYQ